MVLSPTWTLVWLPHNSRVWRKEECSYFTLHASRSCTWNYSVWFCVKAFRVNARQRVWLLPKHQVYLDVFQAYPHSCSAAFRSNSIRSMDVVNSSICEQFNGFCKILRPLQSWCYSDISHLYAIFHSYLEQNKRKMLFKKNQELGHHGFTTINDSWAGYTSIIANFQKALFFAFTDYKFSY